MAHMFFVQAKHIDGMKVLFQKCIDGQYFVIAENEGFADIVQYSSRYDNVKLVTVRADALDTRKELKIG